LLAFEDHIFTRNYLDWHQHGSHCIETVGKYQKWIVKYGLQENGFHITDAEKCC
jgi:hypothetical protein